MKTKNYFRIVFGIASVFLLLIGGINFLVNPYGAYNAPTIAGVNDVYPAAVSYERLQKIERLKKLKPDTIILGSSRALVGLNPSPEFFSDARVYNLGLSASTMKEQLYLLKFAQNLAPLKQVILTLDFFSFNALEPDNPQFDPASLSEAATRFPRSSFYSYKTLLTLDTLLVSIKHMKRLKKLTKLSWNKANGHRQNDGLAYEVSIHGSGRIFRDYTSKVKNNDIKAFTFTYPSGQTTLQYFQEMLNFTRKNNIDVILLTSPVHVQYMDFLKEAGQWPQVEDWKKKLQEIILSNAQRYGSPAYEFWDFYYPSDITAEAVPPADAIASRMKYYWECSHYKEELGDIVLKKILHIPFNDTAYRDFGRKLLP